MQYQQLLEVPDKPTYTVHRIVDVHLDHFAQWKSKSKAINVFLLHWQFDMPVAKSSGTWFQLFSRFMFYKMITQIPIPNASLMVYLNAVYVHNSLWNSFNAYCSVGCMSYICFNSVLFEF
jgi:hypothetical protein